MRAKRSIGGQQRRDQTTGFNLIPPYLPGPAFETLAWLVPELQRRGLAQTGYSGDGNFRGSMGLVRPEVGERRGT